MTKKAFFLSRFIEQVPHGQCDEQEDKESLKPLQGGAPKVVSGGVSVGPKMRLVTRVSSDGACSDNDKNIIYTHKVIWTSIHKLRSTIFFTDSLTERVIADQLVVDNLLY
jgi:hypothetical protein